MLRFSTRLLINLNKVVGPLSSFSILKETHFDSPRIPSQPAEARFACTSAVSSGVFSSRKSFFLCVRADHTMACQSAPPQSVHDFAVKDIKGNDVDLSIYKGKVLIIVNVALHCSLADTNFTELAQLYEKYKDQGLEILAFPCNQFGQKFGTTEEIQEFARTCCKAEYPIFDKVIVNGAMAFPIYKFLKSGKGILIGGGGIRWNFTKFLVDKEGHVFFRYLPTTSPLSMEEDIKKLLEES